MKIPDPCMLLLLLSLTAAPAWAKTPKKPATKTKTAPAAQKEATPPADKEPAKPARPDPVEPLLAVSGQSALVALLHSHFALTGLGHALRAGSMQGQEVATQAGSMQRNLQGLSQQFAALATHPAFDPKLGDLWRSLHQVAALGATAAGALVAVAEHKEEPAYAVALEDQLEAFRSRLQSLIASLQADGK